MNLQLLTTIAFLAFGLSQTSFGNPVLEDSHYCYFSGKIVGHFESEVKGELAKDGEEYFGAKLGYKFWAHPSRGELVITSPLGQVSGEVESWQTHHFTGLKTTLETGSANLTLVCY